MGTRAEQADVTADREVVVTRMVDGPRDLVFEAFTDPRHLARWWGPNGFTLTTQSFDFRVGGTWSFVMHGPDGTDYPNVITWREIERPERISLLHGASADDPEAFESVVSFVEHAQATLVELRSVFPTAQLRNRAVEEYGAVEGGRQTLGRLAEHVASIASGGDAD